MKEREGEKERGRVRLKRLVLFLRPCARLHLNVSWVQTKENNGKPHQDIHHCITGYLIIQSEGKVQKQQDSLIICNSSCSLYERVMSKKQNDIA